MYLHSKPQYNPNNNNNNNNRHYTVPLEQPSFRVACCFRKQDFHTSRTSWLNSLAACRTGSSFIHVELVFINDSICVSVHSKSPVFAKKRELTKFKNRSEWECWSFDVSEKSYKDMLDFCKKQEGKPFDYWGLVFFDFVPCFSTWSGRNGEAWVCSRLVAEALIVGNIFQSNISFVSLTPGDLYNIIRTAATATASGTVGNDGETAQLRPRMTHVIQDGIQPHLCYFTSDDARLLNTLTPWKHEMEDSINNSNQENRVFQAVIVRLNQ